MSDEVRDATDTLRQFLFDNVYIGSAAKREEAKVDILLKMLYKYYLNNPCELTQRLALNKHLTICSGRLSIISLG